MNKFENIAGKIITTKLQQLEYTEPTALRVTPPKFQQHKDIVTCVYYSCDFLWVNEKTIQVQIMKIGE